MFSTPYLALSKHLHYVTGLLLPILLGIFIALPAKSLASPELPKIYKRGLPVVMVFHAEWCHTCQTMRPFESDIEAKTKGKLQWSYIDVDTPIGQGLSKQFGINSTPSYLLFEKDGQLAFKQTGKISLSMLRLQSYKLAGLSTAAPFPKQLESKAVSNYTPIKRPRFHLVRFFKNGCKGTVCKKDSEKYAFFQQQLKLWPAPIAFTQIDMAHAGGYLKSLASEGKPVNSNTNLFYALLDEDGTPLVRTNKPLDDRTIKTMGSAIQLVMIGTLSN